MLGLKMFTTVRDRQGVLNVTEKILPKRIEAESGEGAGLKCPRVLADDPGLIPSTHTTAGNHL